MVSLKHQGVPYPDSKSCSYKNPNRILIFNLGGMLVFQVKLSSCLLLNSAHPFSPRPDLSLRQ